MTGSTRPTPTGSTRASALADLRRAFTEAGLDTPALDARLLVLASLESTPPTAPTPRCEPTREEPKRLAAIAERRSPASRWRGSSASGSSGASPSASPPRPWCPGPTPRHWWSRPRLVPDRTAPLRILDLGTGSGCLLVALLHELPAATGIGVDRALGALPTARANAWRNRVGDRAAFVVSDWARPSQGGST